MSPVTTELPRGSPSQHLHSLCQRQHQHIKQHAPVLFSARHGTIPPHKMLLLHTTAPMSITNLYLIQGGLAEVIPQQVIDRACTR